MALPPLRLSTPPPLCINIHYNHNFIVSSSPYSKRSVDDAIAQAVAQVHSQAPGSLAPVAEEEYSLEFSKTVSIPALGIYDCPINKVPAPPLISYTTQNIEKLVADWESSDCLIIRNIPVPLRYWPDVYQKRPEVYEKRKEIWRQWKVSHPDYSKISKTLINV